MLAINEDSTHSISDIDLSEHIAENTAGNKFTKPWQFYVGIGAKISYLISLSTSHLQDFQQFVLLRSISEYRCFKN